MAEQEVLGSRPRAQLDGTLRIVFAGSVARIVGIPVTAILGLLNTGLVIAHTGSVLYGTVSTIATLGTLLPFADLGVGAAVTTAVAIGSTDVQHRPTVAATIRTAFFALCAVMLAGLTLSWCAALFGWWDMALSRSFSEEERVVISIALSLFFICLPFGLGSRILTGLGKNHIAVLLNLSGTAFALLFTLGLIGFQATPVSFAISSFFGTLCCNVIVAVCALHLLRRAGYGLLKTGPDRAVQPFRNVRLLSGSGWMLIVMIGLPIGLETGRIVLSHTSSAAELSRFALGAQLYALAWSVITTAGGALWTVFAKQRRESAENLRLWRQMVAVFGCLGLAGGAGLIVLGPWLGEFISGGRVAVSPVQMAMFAALLLVQCVHLPAGVLLTVPNELRWQAACVVVMAVLSVVISIVATPTFGGPAVTAGAVIGILLAQILPDLVMVRSFLESRAGVVRSASAGDGPMRPVASDLP
jgi:O-antigen/teichoic acid export membrane protein